MPEGDTIHRLAARWRPDLVGETIASLRLRTHGDVARVRGKRIEEVRALGKNLLVGIESGWVLHLHLGLRGRTRRLAAGTDPARLPAAWPLVLATARATLACTRAMTADLRRHDDLRLEARLRRVGPDLLDAATSLADVVARATAEPHRAREIAVVLADQSIAAGIGNVYKSEVLFLEGVHPFAPVGALETSRVASLYATARELMRSNLGPGPRTTVGLHRGARRRPETATTWVYRRADLPCLRCRARIEVAPQGDLARSTYWCPGCQPARTADATA